MSSAMMISAVGSSAPCATFLAASRRACNQLQPFGLPHLSVRPTARFAVGASQQQKDTTPLPHTKVDVSEAQHEEPLVMFDNTPAGKFFRPESECRPEFGNTDAASVMKFDGPAPETINGRLAMLGITWAFAAEVLTGQTIAEQVLRGSGLIWLLAVAPVLIFASLVPIFGWNESPDSRSFGPFRAKAERWNGRAAMIGFASLLLTENLIIHAPVFGFLQQ